MARLLPLRFWLPLVLAFGAITLAPLFRNAQPPPQCHALALLLSGTLALSGYLFAVILHPESF
jgi:hypothetical protein